MIAFAHIKHSTNLAGYKNEVEIWSVDGELQQAFAVPDEIIVGFPLSMQWNKDDSFIAIRLINKIFVYHVRSNKITGNAYVPDKYGIIDSCWKDETNILVTAQRNETPYHVGIYTANVTEASDGIMLETSGMWFDCIHCFSRLVSSALTFFGKKFPAPVSR